MLDSLLPPSSLPTPSISTLANDVNLILARQSHWQSQPVLLHPTEKEEIKDTSKHPKGLPQLPPNLKVREYHSVSDADFQVLLNLVNETDDGILHYINLIYSNNLFDLVK